MINISLLLYNLFHSCVLWWFKTCDVLTSLLDVDSNFWFAELHINVQLSSVSIKSFGDKCKESNLADVDSICWIAEHVYIHSHQHAGERMFGLEENARWGSGGKLPFVLFMFSLWKRDENQKRLKRPPKKHCKSVKLSWFNNIELFISVSNMGSLWEQYFQFSWSCTQKTIRSWSITSYLYFCLYLLEHKSVRALSHSCSLD